MTTWMLWRAFKNPPRHHPVFIRLVSETYTYTRNGLWLQTSLIQGQMWFWALLFFLNMRLIIFLPFSATLYGAIWAVVVSNRIGQEQQGGTYDLLCVTPHGTTGTLWAIMTGCLHHNRDFTRIISQEAWAVRLVLLVPFIISLHILFAPVFPLTGLTTPIWIIALVVLFYLDHIQSVLLGSLFGLLASHYAPSRLDSRVWAFAAFFATQIASYLLPIAAVWFTTSARQPGQGSLWSLEWCLPISVVCFYGVREIILARLWGLLVGRVGSSPAEFDMVRSTRHFGDGGASYDDPQTVASA